MNGCFWKSAPQGQFYRREVILEFYYPFKPFQYPKFCYDGMVLLCNMFCQDFSSVYCYLITHIKWDVIISSSLRLLLKVWIWYRCPNRIENYYHHDGEQLDFYKKYISKHRAGCSSEEFQFIWQKTALKRTSSTIFNMKKVGLDEWCLNR